jgi:hypothetical protein
MRTAYRGTMLALGEHHRWPSESISVRQVSGTRIHPAWPQKADLMGVVMAPDIR